MIFKKDKELHILLSTLGNKRIKADLWMTGLAKKYDIITYDFKIKDSSQSTQNFTQLCELLFF